MWRGVFALADAMVLPRLVELVVRLGELDANH
jgi:hypothetical protein